MGEFIDAGSDFITVHVESASHLHRTVSVIREAGIKVVIWVMPTARTINVPGTKEKVTELRNIIRDLDIDIVHTNGSRGQFYASLAAKGTKARLVWHVRESKKDILLYDLFLADASDRIICVSDSVRRMRF